MIDLEPLNRTPKSEVLAFPAIAEMPDGTILGNHALRLPMPYRLLVERKVRLFEHQGTIYRDVETAFARRFLASMPKRKVRNEQLEGFALASVPCYVEPFDSPDEWFYVDLKGAYSQIYQRIPWRVEYLRNKYLGATLDQPMRWPFPDYWKVGRSSVVSMSLPVRDVQFITNGIPKHRIELNPYSNPPLVALVWDVLTSVARVAVDYYKARYACVDCAVVNSENLKGYCDFLDQFNLDYRIKHKGPTVVQSLGCWKIGEDSTETTRATSAPLNKLSMTIEEAEWLLLRLDNISRFIQRQTTSVEEESNG